MKGRQGKAFLALTQLREGKFAKGAIEAEFSAIVNGIKKEHEKGTFPDLFRGKTNLTRTFIVAGCNFFLQGTGHIFATVYGAIFVSDLGVVNPFTITVIVAAINVVVSLLAMILVDKVGRR